MSAPKHPGRVFLDASDVAGHLTDYRVVDCRYNLKVKNFGSVEYAKEHVSGAIRADVDTTLSKLSPNTTARHPLPPCAEFIEWCMANGITGERPVLCYDDECGGMGACRLWWMLNSLGAEAYVINGGIQACRAAGVPMESGEPAAQPAPAPAAQWPYKTTFQRHYLVGEIPPNAILTDARAPDRFATTVRPYAGDVMPGHIEGARNLPYASNLVVRGSGKVLRDEAEIRDNILNAVHGTSAPADLSNCVFSCGSGLSACINIALAYQLGLGLPYLYCGSWSEYSGVFRFPMMRSIINDHGMYLQMRSPNLGDNPRADCDTMTLTVDGVPCANPDAEVRSAAAHMHAGEAATAYFKSGRVVAIDVPAPST
ncbi:3-mercaptopyruvate sulfurtransferase [Novymonas esmeraldas]|uniref:3-mercaptopyruvate sulfurtransferase n=1 Tax=Novymonas esmeraldas TaxID=1808958 RepID=A0AAW0EUB7_9TRYP